MKRSTYTLRRLLALVLVLVMVGSLFAGCNKKTDDPTIPEEFAMPKATIDAAIEQAIGECNEKGIKGKETTPFLLARVAELTGGDSLASNIQLVFNNAKVAAQTAVAYCKN